MALCGPCYADKHLQCGEGGRLATRPPFILVLTMVKADLVEGLGIWSDPLDLYLNIPSGAPSLHHGHICSYELYKLIRPCLDGQSSHSNNRMKSSVPET